MKQTFHTAEFMCVQYVAGSTCTNIGVLLLNRAADDLLIQFTNTWEGLDDLEVELIQALGADLQSKAAELGGARLVDYLLTSLSNIIRVTDPRSIIAEDLNVALSGLAAEYLPSLRQLNIPLTKNPTKMFTRHNVKMLIALVVQVTSAANRAVVDCVGPLRLASAASCVASTTCVSLVLFSGVWTHRLLKTDLQQPASAKPVSLRMQERPAAISSISIQQTPISVSPAPPPTIPPRKRRSAIAPRRAAPRLFVLPAPQHNRATKFAMASEANLQVQHVAIDALHTDDAVDVHSLPAPPKENSGALHRFARVIAYPFRKVGTAFTD